jgi:hypothetical protein
MQAVESSSVARVGYDHATEEAYVEFHGGGLYAYRGVPLAVYDELLEAKSKGTYVNEEIKPRFPFRRPWLRR